MPSLVLVPGAVVSVVQPTVAAVVVTEPPKELRIVALPPGAGGGSSGYEHTQSIPASTWTIVLPLSFGRRPGVDIYVNNLLVDTDVEWYPLTGTIVITFPSPTSGVAVIT